MLFADVIPTTRNQSAREETEEDKKSLKMALFGSQVSLVNKSQGLEKKKKEHSRI